MSTNFEVDIYMDEIVSETFGVTRLDRKGRRRFDPEWKALLVSACLEPGASVARLALEHGINANLLWKWIQTHRRVQQEMLQAPTHCAPAFIPVHLAPPAPDRILGPDGAHGLALRPDNHGLEISDPDRAVPLPHGAKVNVSLPSGVTVSMECADVHTLTALIGAVCDVQTGR